MVHDSFFSSSSSDESGQKLAIPYEEFDILITDINEADLVELGHEHDVPHLSPGTFSSPAFPVSGLIHGPNVRYMAPLVCQRADKPNSKTINVWFLIDTGSPFTCLSIKSLEALLGSGNVSHNLYRLAIQDQKFVIECHVSKAHYQEVNLLGADSMRKLELSIVVDWMKTGFKLITQ